MLAARGLNFAVEPAVARRFCDSVVLARQDLALEQKRSSKSDAILSWTSDCGRILGWIKSQLR